MSEMLSFREDDMYTTFPEEELKEIAALRLQKESLMNLLKSEAGKAVFWKRSERGIWKRGDGDKLCT